MNTPTFEEYLHMTPPGMSVRVYVCLSLCVHVSVRILGQTRLDYTSVVSKPIDAESQLFLEVFEIYNIYPRLHRSRPNIRVTSGHISLHFVEIIWQHLQIFVSSFSD